MVAQTQPIFAHRSPNPTNFCPSQPKPNQLLPINAFVPHQNMPNFPKDTRAAAAGGRGAGSTWRRTSTAGGIERPHDKPRPVLGTAHAHVVPCESYRGQAQQTQRAISFVLHRIHGIGSPRDFIRFSRCQFRRILNRSGFEETSAQGRGGAMAVVLSYASIVDVRHRFTKSHERY